jgi:Predicted glycosyl hydrolase
MYGWHLIFVRSTQILKNKKYLDKALEIYDFVYSGWDGNLGGGVYWCEQKKNQVKNTCSNAPSAVLSARLYQLTGDEKFLSRAVETYLWTKTIYWTGLILFIGIMLRLMEKLIKGNILTTAGK